MSLREACGLCVRAPEAGTRTSEPVFDRDTSVKIDLERQLSTTDHRPALARIGVFIVDRDEETGLVESSGRCFNWILYNYGRQWSRTPCRPVGFPLILTFLKVKEFTVGIAYITSFFFPFYILKGCENVQLYNLIAFEVNIQSLHPSFNGCG